MRLLKQALSVAILSGVLTACGSGGTSTTPSIAPQATSSTTTGGVAQTNRPIAHAGNDQTVITGSEVTLDGSASQVTNSSNQITHYAWTQTAGTAVNLTYADTITPRFTAPNITKETTLSFQLVVTNNQGEQSFAAHINITIQPNPSTVIAQAGNDQAVLAKTGVTLNGSQSLGKYFSWQQTSGTAVLLENANTATPSFIAPDISTNTHLTFELTVSNDQGVSHSDSITITIEPVKGSLLITEVSGAQYLNAERWFEVFNNSSNTLNLSNYSLRTLGIEANTYTLHNDLTFDLPNVDIPSGGYMALIANHQNKINSINTPQVQYFKDSSQRTFFWHTNSKSIGYLELVRDNASVDYLTFGDSRLNVNGALLEVAAPLNTTAWTGGSAIAPNAFSNTGQSIARSLPFVDSHTASDWEQHVYATLAAPNDVKCNIDDDADGIPDCSEEEGSTYAGLDLYTLGARKGQKDLFIEVDYMDATQGETITQPNLGMTPQRQSLASLKSIMAKRGYTLHFDVGDLFDQNTGINPSNMDLGGGNEVPYEATVQMCDPQVEGKTLYELKSQHMDPARRSIFYYMLFAYSQDNADPNQGYIAGCGETPGNDTLITLGKAAFNTDTPAQTYKLINKQTSTVMHEFGHNLGLMHGGSNNQHYKPNYLSVMNYMYSNFGLPRIGTREGDRYHYLHRTQCKTTMTNSIIADPNDFILDYSDGSSAPIDENHINEHAGLGRTGSNAVDFNCNGIIESNASHELNNTAHKSVLHDHNDWANIQLFFAQRSQNNVYAARHSLADEIIIHPADQHRPDPTWNDVQPVTPEPLTPLY